MLHLKKTKISMIECTGFFASKATASKHLKAGAKKVLISAPAGNDVDATIVYGVNHDTLKSSHQVVSNASWSDSGGKIDDKR